MIKRFLVVGDIHFGYYPPELLYKEFKLIINTIEDNAIDPASAINNIKDVDGLDEEYKQLDIILSTLP